MRMSLPLAVIICILRSRSISAWLSSSSRTTPFGTTPAASHQERQRPRGLNEALSRRFRTETTRHHATPIMDAEFERVQERNQTDSTTATHNHDDDDAATKVEESPQPLGSKSLFQVALESDPDWNETRIPFMDGDNFIDVKLAFMAELDGEQYGIGIPFDHGAAVTIERKDGTTENLSPDDPEHDEMIRIMADQLKEHVGQDLTMKLTPRVLTIKGPLEKYTANWRETLVPAPLDSKTLLDDSDEDLKFFHDFMRQELGEEEYTKTMNESPDDLTLELADLFGDSSTSSPPTLEDLFSSMQGDGDGSGDDLFIQEMQDFVDKNIAHDGVALKLLSYSLKDGNKYSVVQPLQPFALVAKYTENGEDVRFDLLSPADADLLIPRLEQVCQDDLQKAGLTGDNLVKN